MTGPENREPQTEARPKAAGRKAKTRKAKNIKARWLIALAVVVLLAATVLIVLNLRLFGGKSKVADEWKTPSYLSSKTMNVLICGVDEDPGDKNRVNKMTDVIIVANLDLESDKATLLQIPRDTYVGEDLVYTGKINALYNWGYKTAAEGKSGGIGTLMEVINDQFQLPLDHYVTISMDGFRKVVDLLGGVDITLDKEVSFDQTDVDANGKTVVVKTITFTAGVNHLDGEMAELFVRNRNYSMADIDRLNMQRYFFAGLMAKVSKLSTSDLVSLANTIYPYLDTDFTIQQMLQLALDVKSMSTDAIEMVRVPGEAVAAYGIYGQDVYSVHLQELADLLNKYMRPYQDAVPAEKLKVIELSNQYDWLGDNEGTLNQYGG